MPLISSSTTGSVSGTRCLASSIDSKGDQARHEHHEALLLPDSILGHSQAETRKNSQCHSMQHISISFPSMKGRRRINGVPTPGEVRGGALIDDRFRSALCAQPEVFCFHFFHQRNCNPTSAAVCRRTLKLDFRHGPHRGGHIV